MANQNFEPPKTIEAMGIHFVYVRESIERLTESVNRNSEHYATKEEVKEGYVTKLEFQKLKSKTAPIIAVATLIGSAVIAGLAAAITSWIAQGGLK